jgi:hypothetical protein
MTLPNVHPKRMADEHLLPAALLETGDTLNFLEVRKHSLRVKIKDSKLSAATGKVSGLSAALGGGLLYFTLANPLGALLACGGLAAYGLAVGAQWLQTGKLHPFPLTSKTADESDEELSASTVTGGSSQIARSHIHEEASYLEPREKAEYELLHHAPQGLLNAIGSVAPAQRWACYCFLLDAHRTGNLDDYRDRATLETVLGNSSVYHSHLPEASERFPEIGLDSATAPSLPAANENLPTATSSPIGPTTKFGAIEVPNVPAASSPKWDEDEQLMTSSDRHEWMQDLLSYPSVLIWGAPGAGKSTFAEWLVTERAKAGHKLEILDPHREFGQWDGLDVFGDGMNFNAIDDRLKAFADLVESRYLGRSKKADFNPRPLTVLAEEFTQWSKKCDHSASFFEMSVSDIRKINCHVVYVSHNRTLTALGGAKGLAATRDSALLELELLAKVDEATGKAAPMLKGLLKYPGRASIEVAIPAMKTQRTAVKVAQTFEDDVEVSQVEQPEKESSESEQSDPKANIKKPNLSRTELVLSIAELGEWSDENPGLSFDQMYGNYSARRKGFSRPEFRFLLTQIENLDA